MRTKKNQAKETWIKTKLELARLLKISRTTLDTFITLEGFPSKRADGAWPLEKIRSFTAKRLGRDEEARSLKLQRLRLQVERSDRELEAEAGKYVAREALFDLVANYKRETLKIVRAFGMDSDAKARILAGIDAIDAEAFLKELTA
ncbi:MAG: hypothetical protein LV479_03175 [Methylacidiphilales bacterium]|nr:hypothetical protein [Candidatus Methylacidiphilales bacterium]